MFLIILQIIRSILGMCMLGAILWLVISKIQYNFTNYYFNIFYTRLEFAGGYACQYLKPLLILEHIDYTPVILIFVLWLLQKMIDVVILYKY